MKSFCVFLLLTVLSLEIINAQTINPSCYSNANGWSITKVENNYDGTYVYLNFYSYKQNYEFWIVPEMYIENYNSPDTKYYVKSFMNNQLNRKYKLEPYTQYDFILIFDRIPSWWTEINIKEPYQGESNSSWYWNYISLNKSQDERLKKDNFIINRGINFLDTFAHPTNKLIKYKYSVDYNAVRITLYYHGYYTDLSIKFSGNLVSDIAVISDNDIVPPFLSLMLMKNYIASQRNSQQFTTQFQQQLNKAIEDMNGREVACIALTILYNL